MLLDAARRAPSWQLVYVGERGARLSPAARWRLRWRPGGHTPTVVAGTPLGIAALITVALARTAWRYVALAAAGLAGWLWRRVEGRPRTLCTVPRRWVLLVLSDDLPLGPLGPALRLLEGCGRTVGVHLFIATAGPGQAAGRRSVWQAGLPDAARARRPAEGSR